VLSRHFPLAPAKVGKQFQTAEQLGAARDPVGDEWPHVAVKDLANGHAELVSCDSLLEAP